MEYQYVTNNYPTEICPDLAELLGTSPPKPEMKNAASDGPRNGVKYSAAHENR